MMPPMLLRIHVEERGKRPIRLWIPLFLVWPLVLFLFVLLLPLLVLVLAIALVLGKLRRALAFGGLLYALICCSRGFEVNVESERKGERVLVRLV